MRGPFSLCGSLFGENLIYIDEFELLSAFIGFIINYTRIIDFIFNMASKD
jgi:hypothetical protein